jgi:NADP-dependent 3-hydroxy acid dehydrogenase YdfG
MTMGWRSDMPKIDGVMRRSAFKIGERNRMIDINIRGVLHGIAAVLPRMEA